MTINSISTRNGWPSLQLLPKDRLGEIYTVFNPSVFRGTGSEPRKGIVFAVPRDVYEDLAKIDSWAQKSQAGQGVHGIWNSCLKEAGTYGEMVKAKINVTGPSQCIIVDSDGKQTPWPENWVRLKVIPILEIRGVYNQKTGSGLILECTHLMIGETDRKQCVFL